MSGLFRSESMVYARMVMSDDTAYDTVRQIGTFGKAHVVDLSLRHDASGPSDRLQHYKKRVATCGFYERKLGNFHTLMDMYGVASPSIDTIPAAIGAGDILDTVRAFIEPLESALTKNILYAREQRLILNALMEHIFVLQVVNGEVVPGGDSRTRGAPPAAYGTFSGEETSLLARDEDDEERDEEKGGDARIVPTRDSFTNSIFGIIPDVKVPLFERMVFRVSRGNVVTKLTSLAEPMDDPLEPGHTVRKSVFQLTFVGEQLDRRLRKIISFFGAVEYEVPSDAQIAQRTLHHLRSQLVDAKQMLAATESEVRHTLSSLAWDDAADTSPYLNYLHALRVEKGICDTLKKCAPERDGSALLRLDAWLPADEYSDLQRHLKLAVAATGLQPAACDQLQPGDASSGPLGEPPTYFKTTKFTSPYQGIVDTYGVPRYKEINPGLFTLISFPFLFGVMYGDIGHGTIMTIAAIYLIANEEYYLKQIRYGRMDEIMGMVFGGRYMLILMGLFAVYAGLIYNDCFSIPFNLFGSKWTFDADDVATSHGVYPFGVDPSWYHTTNELAFFNSLKMKLAVTLGVAQMTFGIVLGAFNNTYFGDRSAVYLEFLPRITFMLATFGYMIFLIVFKLSIDWTTSAISPPNLVQTMIAMFLAPGVVDEDKQLYAGQAGVQAFLLFLAFVSVPLMLLGKPLLARREHNTIFGNRTHGASEYSRVGGLDQDDGESKDDEEGGVVVVAAAPAPAESSGHGFDPKSPHYSFSTHLTENSIHTIEFVLGAVSNTASYLRLWALSLAHAELADVFWKKLIVQVGLEGSPIFMVAGMAAWCGATFAVLLAMDSLECFLHALRLHWVEFQNKFFHADGYAYRPFAYDGEEVQE